jgi:hypothetical protein
MDTRYQEGDFLLQRQAFGFLLVSFLAFALFLVYGYGTMWDLLVLWMSMGRLK